MSNQDNDGETSQKYGPNFHFKSLINTISTIHHIKVISRVSQNYRNICQYIKIICQNIRVNPPRLKVVVGAMQSSRTLPLTSGST